ncbi:5-formyltetrahydrofolate cyclo-ligase [Crocosphaera chwakensis]|uniref:5-formyltetrahydrofolate cyclo-ligase n=1 Tax=Crocosphaera chwakensis CCY0110 TaxID=391612 RepID=A3INJ8_9CHRO|nr:5-formyltetrahydrofolate cyclo-ligase [Crocosphaera chwakensis]EAZ91896.1 5-formyltetrahydrofolate cyclo-ligase [Crocosphaera chwakensis CCY0110]
MNFKETKKQLRKKLIQERENLSKLDWKNNSQKICKNLQNYPLFQQSKTILAYFSIRQEPDLTYLFSTNHNWGFPRCVKKSLIWHFWQPQDPLIPGKYGIVEPSANAPILSHETVDLILVPAVACDYNGYRLGYGGGFYDRLLNSPQWSSIPTVGIIFEFALLPQLPCEPWDQQLQAICTENNIISICT